MLGHLIVYRAKEISTDLQLSETYLQLIHKVHSYWLTLVMGFEPIVFSASGLRTPGSRQPHVNPTWPTTSFRTQWFFCNGRPTDSLTRHSPMVY